LIGGNERGKVCERLSARTRLSVVVDEGEAAAEQRTDRPLVALAEIGDERAISVSRGLLLVACGGAAHEPRSRPPVSGRGGRDQEAAHRFMSRLHCCAL